MGFLEEAERAHEERRYDTESFEAEERYNDC